MSSFPPLSPRAAKAATADELELDAQSSDEDEDEDVPLPPPPPRRFPLIRRTPSPGAAGPDGKLIPAFDMMARDGDLGGPASRSSGRGSRGGTPPGGRGRGYGRGGYPGAAPLTPPPAYFSPPYNDPDTGGYYDYAEQSVRMRWRAEQALICLPQVSCGW